MLKQTKIFLICDLDGTLVHLNGDWPRVKELSLPYKDVLKASEEAFKTNNKNFFEQLNKLELIQEPTPLNLISIVQKLTIEKFIVTNNTTATGKYVNDIYNLGCKDVIGIDQVSEGKPSDLGIKILLNKYKLNLKNGYFIGNQLTDKVACEKAGLSFIDAKMFN